MSCGFGFLLTLGMGSAASESSDEEELESLDSESIHSVVSHGNASTAEVSTEVAVNWKHFHLGTMTLCEKIQLG